jgi:hypothetical protein
VDLLNDPEFEKYRVKEIEEGVLMLRSVINGNSSDYFKGAMDMLRRIINVPTVMIPRNNESQRLQADTLKAKAFDVFEAKMIRKFAQEEE